MIELRPYQLAAIEQLRQNIRAGHRSQILVLPTGGGKTVVATHLMQEADRKMSKACFVVDRRAIVNQTSATLERYGLDHGVIMADHPRRKPWHRIQVASAQTLEARGFFPGLNLLMADECHSSRRQLSEYIRNQPSVITIGLTATPFTPGLGKLYSAVVNVVTTDKLVEDGWLVPLKVYAAKAPDMTGAKVVAGEWVESEMEERGLKIVGDIVTGWRDKVMQHFGRAVKTIVFSASVAHGEELCRQFNAIGYRFEQVSYKDGNNARREALLKEFAKPDSSITGLISCEALSKGFDQVDILCGISARPYRKSFSSHIQQLGRVMRPSPGKEYALWLCHSSNYLRFYDDMADLFANGVTSLSEATKKDSEARKEPSEKAKELKCGACGFVLPPHSPACPACGNERRRRSLVETLPGQLVAVEDKRKTAKPEPPLPLWTRDRDRTYTQLCGYGMQRKKGDVAAAKRWAAAQYKQLFDAWPTQPFNAAAPPHIDFDLKGRVLANTIRWAKGRGRAMKEEVRAMNLGKE